MNPQETVKVMAAARAQMHNEASGSRRTSSGSSARGMSAQRVGGGTGGHSSPSLRKQQSGDSGMNRLPSERRQPQPKSPSVRRDSYGSPREAERHDRARAVGSPVAGGGTSGSIAQDLALRASHHRESRIPTPSRALGIPPRAPAAASRARCTLETTCGSGRPRTGWRRRSSARRRPGSGGRSRFRGTLS